MKKPWQQWRWWEELAGAWLLLKDRMAWWEWPLGVLVAAGYAVGIFRHWPLWLTAVVGASWQVGYLLVIDTLERRWR